MNKEWKELNETIIALVKKHYRLQGIVWYEPLPPELESERNSDQSKS